MNQTIEIILADEASGTEWFERILSTVNEFCCNNSGDGSCQVESVASYRTAMSMENMVEFLREHMPNNYVIADQGNDAYVAIGWNVLYERWEAEAKDPSLYLALKNALAEAERKLGIGWNP